MAREGDVVRGTCADATQHARPCGKATRAHVRRRRRTGGADTWCWPSKSTRTNGSHHVAGGLTGEGPTG